MNSALMPARLINATAFIDWNTQIFAAKPPKVSTQLQIMDHTLAFVSKSIGVLLSRFSAIDRFQVSLRVYHGWHKGFEVTARRKALRQIIAGADFISLSNRPNIIIRREVAFGDKLMSASNERLHTKLDCHLPNTLRNSLTVPDEEEEKMVDTAIASDMVDLAHREPSSWLIVMGRDDDLVPPVFVAEAVVDGHGGRVILCRDRPDTPFLKLDRLRYST